MKPFVFPALIAGLFVAGCSYQHNIDITDERPEIAGGQSVEVSDVQVGSPAYAYWTGEQAPAAKPVPSKAKIFKRPPTPTEVREFAYLLAKEYRSVLFGDDKEQEKAHNAILAMGVVASGALLATPVHSDLLKGAGLISASTYVATSSVPWSERRRVLSVGLVSCLVSSVH